MKRTIASIVMVMFVLTPTYAASVDCLGFASVGRHSGTSFALRAKAPEGPDDRASAMGNAMAAAPAAAPSEGQAAGIRAAKAVGRLEMLPDDELLYSFEAHIKAAARVIAFSDEFRHLQSSISNRVIEYSGVLSPVNMITFVQKEGVPEYGFIIHDYEDEIVGAMHISIAAFKDNDIHPFYSSNKIEDLINPARSFDFESFKFDEAKFKALSQAKESYTAELEDAMQNFRYPDNRTPGNRTPANLKDLLSRLWSSAQYQYEDFESAVDRWAQNAVFGELSLKPTNITPSELLELLGIKKGKKGMQIAQEMKLLEESPNIMEAIRSNIEEYPLKPITVDDVLRVYEPETDLPIDMIKAFIQRALNLTWLSRPYTEDQLVQLVRLEDKLFRLRRERYVAADNLKIDIEATSGKLAQWDPSSMADRQGAITAGNKKLNVLDHKIDEIKRGIAAVGRKVAVVGDLAADRETIISWLREWNFDVDNQAMIKILESIDEAGLNELKEQEYLVIQKVADGYIIMTKAAEMKVEMTATQALSDVKQKVEEAITSL